MAKILAFRPVALKRDAMSAPEQGGSSAELILFPGVRYERWAEIEGHASHSISPPRHRGGRQRDILEIAE